MTNERTREDSIRYSVQTQPNMYSGFYTMGIPGMYAQTLPSLYDVSRQWYLRRLALHPQNNFWQSATTGIARDVASAKWEITGKRRVKFYQDMLINAEKGEGWATFVSRLLENFHSCDDGAVVELIGRGKADKYLPKEQITGIATLDPLYCYFTGNADYPVVYADPLTGGRLHKLHWSRVYRLIDNSRNDPMLRGRGFCALSRAVGWVQQNISQQTYVGESLSHEPPPGILLINGVSNKKQWQDAWKMYLAALGKAGAIDYTSGTVNYLPIVEYVNPDSSKPVTIEFIRFSVMPDGMEIKTQLELQAKGIAAGLNIDVNDFFPMDGAVFGGSGEKARILDKKAKGKTIGYLIGEIDRLMNNRVLPDALRFVSKYKDTERSQEEADTAKAHTDVAAGLAPYFPTGVIASYLVKSVPGLAEVALNEDGTLIQADDTDVLASDDPPETAQTVDDTVDEVNAEAENQTESDSFEARARKAKKDWDDTRMNYEAAVYDAIAGMNDGSIESRRRAGTVMRGHISAYGRKAYINGLAEGGVEVAVLEGDDEAAYKSLVAENSVYVTNLTGSIYNGETVLSEAGIRSRVQAWVVKTLEPFRIAGLSSADANGLYEFYGDDGDESCDDCRRLKGRRFRLKDWIASDYLPSASNCRLECGGYNCDHGIRRVEGGRADRKSMIGLRALTDPYHFEILTLAEDCYSVIRRRKLL